MNPSRSRFIDVIRRMGGRIDLNPEGDSVGEPFGTIMVQPQGSLTGTVVGASELPEVIDEVPLLAALASAARGESRFEGAEELRLKESNRLESMMRGIRDLGGEAVVEGDALVVAGGGLSGGRADAGGDHRIAMALIVAGLAASGTSEIDGVEWADISFPGFVDALVSIGARVEAA